MAKRARGAAGAGAGVAPLDINIGFIGGGMMASAMVGGLLAKGVVAPEAVMVADPTEALLGKHRESGTLTTSDNKEVAAFADVLVLAVKPHIVPLVLSQVAGVVGSTLVVSIAAGVPTNFLENLLTGDSDRSPRVIRVMPNTPCLVGEAASAVCGGKHATSADVDLVTSIMRAVGEVVSVPETLMDAVTGLSGSGPAYVFQFIEALADGGVRAGLPRPVALNLAAQMVKGAATMVQVTGSHPGVLKDQVCSPGGTTIAGVHALEKGGMRATVMNAVVAAANRSAELRALEQAKLKK